MYAEYVRWQFVLGPRWLAVLAISLIRALVHIFSVPLLLRTLLAHWHKDALPYRPGALSNYAMTFAWNLISRGIGLCIRTAVLTAWLGMELVVAAVSAVILVAFTLWPLLIGISAATGIAILAAGI